MAEIAVERQDRSQSIDWSAALWAGVIAGTVFLMMEMFLMPLFGFAPSIWAPPRSIAAIGLGESALPPPATFDLRIVMVGTLIHFATSIPFALAVAFLIRNLGMGAAIAVGVVAALLLHVFVAYLMTPVWPWLNGANWFSIVVHVVFGALVAWWYKSRAHPAAGRA